MVHLSAQRSQFAQLQLLRLDAFTQAAQSLTFRLDALRSRILLFQVAQPLLFGG